MSKTRTWMKTGWLTVLVVVGLVVGSSAAAAEQSGDVVVLLTEIVHQGVVDDGEHVQFWWGGGDRPQWTDSDEAVLDALRDAEIEPAMPDKINVSRIYRRPDLSTQNAAQFGGLVGVDRVLVGTVEYRPVGPIAPLGHEGVEAHAEVTLVPAGSSDAVALDQFVVTRQLFDESSEASLQTAREVTGRALGEVMGQSLRRASGHVGIDGREELIALRDVQRAAHLEAVRNRLVELDEIDDVVERWASEGIIALAVESADEADDDAVDYARRVLEHHDFEEFELSVSPDPVVEGTVEFRVESQRHGR